MVYINLHLVKTKTTCNYRSTAVRWQAPPVTIAEPLQMIAHHCTPKLPPVTRISPIRICATRLFPIRTSVTRLFLFRSPVTRMLSIRSSETQISTVLLPQSSNNSTSCIRPQRLYSPALRPSLLDRADTIQDSIRPSQLRTSIDRSRSQGLL